jgi:putative transposase
MPAWPAGRPNHFHVILYFREEKFDLNKVVSNSKRFIAYEIIKRLEQMSRLDLLTQLQEAITPRERGKGQIHRVFEESFDAKPIFNDRFLLQKLQYMHLNPVRGKWRLVEDYRDYVHSSASFYELGMSKLFEPVHYRSL